MRNTAILNSQFQDLLQGRKFSTLGDFFSDKQNKISPQPIFGPTTFQVLGDDGEVVAGGTGSNTIVGGAGNDLITTAGGINFLVGSGGQDTIVGGPGDDTLIGNQGSDTLIGGSGNDIFEIFSNQNSPGEIDTVVDFEAGNDAFVIVGGETVEYDNDNGRLSIDGQVTAQLDAGLNLNVLAREDSFLVFSNGDAPSLLGASASRPQADTTSVPAVPLLEGSTEAQFEATALAGGLFVAGFEDRRNVFRFGESDDVSVGGDRADLLTGQAGDDHLAGSRGNDRIFGGSGDDVLQGDDGNDFIQGGSGSDLVYGGQGRDIYQFRARDFQNGELDVIIGFEQGLDSLRIRGSRNVDYDSGTGIVSINGEESVVIDTGLDLDIIATRRGALIS